MFFKLLRGRILQDPRDSLGQKGRVQRPALGLVAVNLLPARSRAEASVKGLQTSLQKMVKDAAGDGVPEWKQLLSPRHAMKRQPLQLYGENLDEPSLPVSGLFVLG